MFSSAKVASTPPSPVAAINVKYLAEEELIIDVSLVVAFEGAFALFFLLS